MVAHTFKIRQDLREHNTALRLTFSFLKTLELLFKILVAHVVIFLFHYNGPAQHIIHILRRNVFDIVQGAHALLFHLIQLFQDIFRELLIPFFHVIRIPGKIDRMVADPFQIADNNIITIDLYGV